MVLTRCFDMMMTRCFPLPHSCPPRTWSKLLCKVDRGTLSCWMRVQLYPTIRCGECACIATLYTCLSACSGLSLFHIFVGKVSNKEKSIRNASEFQQIYILRLGLSQPIFGTHEETSVVPSPASQSHFSWTPWTRTAASCMHAIQLARMTILGMTMTMKCLV